MVLWRTLRLENASRLRGNLPTLPTGPCVKSTRHHGLQEKLSRRDRTTVGRTPGTLFGSRQANLPRTDSCHTRFRVASNSTAFRSS